MELLVALVVLSAAVTAGQATFRSVADQRARALDALEAAIGDAAVRRVLVEWLRGARLATEPGTPAFVGMDRRRERMDDDELTFLTSARVFAESGDVIVHLHIDRDPRTPESGLVAAVKDQHGDDTRRLELAGGATGLDVQYLYHQASHRWLTAWISDSAVPDAIRLTVSAEHPDSLPRLLQRPVLVATGYP